VENDRPSTLDHVSNRWEVISLEMLIIIEVCGAILESGDVCEDSALTVNTVLGIAISENGHGSLAKILNDKRVTGAPSSCCGS
jgi:hypothetical protein